jgi:hypothetical protein
MRIFLDNGIELDLFQEVMTMRLITLLLKMGLLAFMQIL